METITIPKKKYELLERRAELYEKVLKEAESEIFPIEMYSDERIKEFLKEDRLPRQIKQKAKKFLNGKLK